MKVDWNSPFWQGAVHTAKVVAFLFVSGGLTELVNNLAKLNLSPMMILVITGGINSILAWVTRTYSVSMMNQVSETKTESVTTTTVETPVAVTGTGSSL